MQRIDGGRQLAQVSIYSDESGCTTFSDADNVSRFFIICSITPYDESLWSSFHEFRVSEIWNDVNLDSEFHACKDHPAIREKVLNFLADQDFRIDATIFEKRKAQPHITASEERFLKYTWFFHFKHLLPQVSKREHDQIAAFVASRGTKKQRGALLQAINDVMYQSATHPRWKAAFWPACSDPCLMVADYCSWSIQRYWERGDDQYRSIVSDKISSEFDIWQRGENLYY